MVAPVQMNLALVGTLPPYRRNRPTSLAAAVKLAPALSDLLEDIMTALSGREMTPDEYAAIVGCHVLKIRPRFTELASEKYGWLIEQTDQTRPSALGNPQVVYRLSEHGRKYVANLREVRHDANGTPTASPSANESERRVS